MSRLGQILRQHKIAIILAILTSLITIFPQIYFRADHKDIYQGIELLPDSPWAARAREVQDGHPNFGAIYYKDGKDNPYLFQPLGSMVVGYMGQAFSLDINDTLLLSRVVLPFTVFLLIYSFVYAIWRERLVASACASLLLLADSIQNFSGLSRIFHGLSPDNFLRLSRPVNPAMIYILLFSFLLAFWFFYRKRDWKIGVVATVLLGLNFYNYFYSWTYMFAFGGILGLFLLIQRKWKDAFAVAAVYLGGLVVAIPYIGNLLRTMNHPVYADASMRSGIVLSHAPFFVGIFVIIALVIFGFGFSREDKGKYFFGLSLLLAPFVTLNQQILTGKILQEAHYHWFFHKPIGVILILVTVFYLMGKFGFERYKKAFAVVVILLSIATGVFVQAKSYGSDVRDGGQIAIERQKYGPVMKWLNENVQKETMVLANDEVSHLTVIYTPLNVFYHRAAGYSLTATQERLLEVLLTFYRLRGIDANEAREIFFAERGHISANIYVIYYRELLGSYEAIPDEKIQEVLDAYIKTLSVPAADWIKQVLNKYEVEYVVWDKNSDPTWNLDQYKFLQKSAEFGGVLIYQVI